MTSAKKIEIDEELKLQEAERMLSIAYRKKWAAELLNRPLFEVESVQMCQQVMELCAKAIMIVLVGHFYQSHDFPPRVVEETLRAYQQMWPSDEEPLERLERCFKLANRWSSERVLGTYGYVYGSSGEVVSEREAKQANEEAEFCLEQARVIIYICR